MIKSKKDYKYYISKDAEAHQIKSLKSWSLFHGHIYKFQHSLRYLEFVNNEYSRNKKALMMPIIIFHKLRYYILSKKLNISIPLNVTGPGLCIVHGNILINPKAKIGDFARIMGNVTVGVSSYNSKCPRIGNYVFLGDGAKILGDISIVDKVTIGANSVVTKDITETGVYAGIPAVKVSSKKSGFQYCKRLQQIIDND